MEELVTPSKAAPPAALGTDRRLVPHTKGMLFVDKTVHCELEQGRGEFSIPIGEDMTCVRSDGTVDAYWYVEMMAQGAAALYGLQRPGQQERPDVGFLIGIRELTIADNSKRPVQVGDQLLAKAKLDVEFFPFGSYLCSLWRGEELLAEGEMRFVLDHQNQENDH